MGGTELAGRYRFTIDLGSLYDGWCALQTSYAQGAGATTYACLPNTVGGSDASGCYYEDPSTAAHVSVDCGKYALCAVQNVCSCDATGCVAAAGTQIPFDFHQIYGGTGWGSVRLADGLHNIYLNQTSEGASAPRRFPEPTRAAPVLVASGALGGCVMIVTAACGAAHTDPARALRDDHVRSVATRMLECDREAIVVEDARTETEWVCDEERAARETTAPAPRGDETDTLAELASAQPACVHPHAEEHALRAGTCARGARLRSSMRFHCEVCGAMTDRCVPEELDDHVCCATY